MRCSKVHRLISTHLDGEVDAVREKALAEHLAGCPECRGFAAEVAQVAERLDEVTAPEPRWGFADRMLARLPLPGSPVARRSVDFLRPAPVGLGAAAFCFGVLLTVFVSGAPESNGAVSGQDLELLAGDYFTTLSEISIDEQLLALLGDAEG